MSRRAALLAIALLVLLCARGGTAWRDAVPLAAAPSMPARHPGDPALGWISVRIEDQWAPALRRGLELILERDGR